MFMLADGNADAAASMFIFKLAAVGIIGAVEAATAAATAAGTGIGSRYGGCGCGCCCCVLFSVLLGFAPVAAYALVLLF